MGEVGRQRPDGTWERALPLPEPFGVVWERCWRFRRDRGERLPFALIRGWVDARALRKVAPDA